MKISLKWLNQYVDVQEFFLNPEKLAAVLTAGGLEVEQIEDRAKNFEHVVVGQILEKNQHPDADKLSVCQVMTGEGVCHTIVCGAKNHHVDDLVIVALPGAVLPGDFKIKRSKIREVESSGMLCSMEELGMDDDGSGGIIILQAKADVEILVGQSAAEYFGFDDVVFELKVTPNRADCLSHYGLAREVSCLLKDRPLRQPQLGRPCSVESGEEPVLQTVDHSTKKEMALDVRATDLCLRYAGRVVKGVKVAQSPAWLRQRLESVGINSINNVVDVTNYVMLELGQPLHAFDMRFLQRQKIIVNMSSKDEEFVTLDGTEIKLTGEELLIRDGNQQAVALAGVIGGLNSGVKDDSCDLFIESAYFAPATVRKTSKRFGIETDSAYRFSRGVNPDVAGQALDRACQLILDVAGGEAYCDHHDHYPEPLKREPIELSVNYVGERLGFHVSQEDVEDCLRRVGCEVVQAREGFIQVLPPLYRWDISLDMDLVEEVARLQGYDKIPETLPLMNISPKPNHGGFVFHNRVADGLVSLGYRQALNYAFVSSEFQEKILGNAGVDGVVRVRNPLSEELNVMRMSLIPGLLKNLSFNNSYGNSYGRLFETGFVFCQQGDGDYKESARLAFASWGQGSSVWQKSDGFPVVFELKSAIEKLLSMLGISSWTWLQEPESLFDAGLEFLHSGQRTVLKCEGKRVGCVGTLHPRLKSEWKLRGDVAVAELDLDLLSVRQPRVNKVRDISKFPVVKRDLALVMPVNLAVMDVAQVIKKICGKVLKEVEVFDIYEGTNLETGQRSVGFRMEYQDGTGTLDEERLVELQNRILSAVGEKFSIGIR